MVEICTERVLLGFRLRSPKLGAGFVRGGSMFTDHSGDDEVTKMDRSSSLERP